MTEREITELAEKELLTVCVHEFGHVFACHAHGIWAFPEVWPNNGGGEDEKAWLGTTRYFRDGLEHTDRPIIGLAGVVAEILLLEFPGEGVTFEDAERRAEQVRKQYSRGRNSTRTAMTEWCHAIEYIIWSKIDMDELSQTDLEMMGDAWGKRLRKTVSLITKHSSLILNEAEKLADMHKFCRED